MRDVLVFTPVLKLEPETVKGIFSLEWDGPMAVLFQRDNPDQRYGLIPKREIAIRNHCHQYRRGREAFLAGRYEAMLVIESDILPPRDTLRRLAALEVDLAYGCYVFRGTEPVVNVFERYYASTSRKLAANVGESLTARGLWGEALQQGVVECSGGGLGCVLIRRKVLEAVAFRHGLEEGSKAFCDSYFTIDAYRAGFTMKADTRVLCGHKVDGEMRYPIGAV